MTGILERLQEAMNSHDAQGMASLFAPDYRSSQPVHPNRGFTGSDQVLANWTAVFEGVPDFHADLLASAAAGDTAWGEWDWSGTHRDGSAFRMRGVTVAIERQGSLVEARLYMEPVEEGGDDIDASVQELYRPGR